MNTSPNITKNMQKVLDFLYVETYTCVEILQMLLQQNNIQSTYVIVKRMVEYKYLTKVTTSFLFGRNINLFGITKAGLSLIEQHSTEYILKRPVFQKSKISLTMLPHKIDIQRFHVLLINKDWTNWVDGSQLGRRSKDQKIPDAVAMSPNGIVYSFEIEREIKASHKYPEIIKSHLVSRKLGKWQRIIYLCPNNNMAKSLERKLRKVKSITYQGKSIQLTEKYYELFSFYGYEEFERKINGNQFLCNANSNLLNTH